MVTELVSRAKEDNIRFVSFQFTDIFGTIKSVTLPVVQLEGALEEGIFFDGSSVQGFARIFESDMVLVPDPATYRVLPWSVPERRRARIICDVHTTDGNPLASSPRTVLKRTLARAEAKGLTYNVGPELEFFLFKRNGDAPFQPVPHDIGGYFDFSPRDEAQQVRSEIVIALEALGIHVEMSHHEDAAGQHEIDFRYADALSTADSAITLKYTVRAIAAIYPNYVQIVASAESGVTNLEDLKGKGVSVGAPASGTELNARAIFAAAGMSYDDLGKLEYLPYAESAELIKNRQLDATLQSSGLGVAFIQDLAATHDINLVGIPAEVVESIGAPYVPSVIPAGTYQGQDADVPTAAIGNILVTHDGVDEETAYQMTKLLFENLDRMVAAHSAAGGITPEGAIVGLPIPLHPGAERYYREIGLIQ